jgi:hypothetical protein
MNKAEHTRRAAQVATLARMGYSESEADALRRISIRLRNWYSLECGEGYGRMERDEKTGKPYFVREYQTRDGAWHTSRSLNRDLERGALARLAAIARHPYYLQGDPRGAVLYLLREGDVPEGESAESHYTRGVCIY